MDARDAMHTTPLLEACPVAPERFQDVMPRLHTCMDPVLPPLWASRSSAGH